MALKTLLAAALLASSAFCAPITISTGTAAPWIVNGNPAVIETTIPSPWISNFGGGSWVGTTANDGDPAIGAAAGTYLFTLNLGSYVGGSGSFSLQYAGDNSVVWSLSFGTLAGTTSCDAVVSPTSNCFGAGAGAPRSLTGIFASNSVLTATLVNGGTVNNPMGLLVAGSADSNGVPEPSTYAMFAMGIAAITFARHRRQ